MANMVAEQSWKTQMDIDCPRKLTERNVGRFLGKLLECSKIGRLRIRFDSIEFAKPFGVLYLAVGKQAKERWFTADCAFSDVVDDVLADPSDIVAQDSERKSKDKVTSGGIGSRLEVVSVESGTDLWVTGGRRMFSRSESGGRGYGRMG